MKNKQAVRTLGRLVARELSHEQLDKIQGQMCATAVAGGSKCPGPGGLELRDFGP